MKTRHILISILLLLPALTFAGEIYGTLKKDGKPVAKQEVKIMQNDKVFGTATTDENGYFSITLKEVGPFRLEVVGYDGAVFNVFSNNNSNGYTLSLIKAGDKWELKKL